MSLIDDVKKEILPVLDDGKLHEQILVLKVSRLCEVTPGLGLTELSSLLCPSVGHKDMVTFARRFPAGTIFDVDLPNGGPTVTVTMMTVYCDPDEEQALVIAATRAMGTDDLVAWITCDSGLVKRLTTGVVAVKVAELFEEEIARKVVRGRG